MIEFWMKCPVFTLGKTNTELYYIKIYNIIYIKIKTKFHFCYIISELQSKNL